MEDMLLYAKYALAIVTGCLAIGLTVKFIQKIADLIIGGLLLGALAVPCVAIANGTLTAWGEVAATAVASGAIAALFCMPLLPLSTFESGGSHPKG